jgi:hypothetical protein
MATAPQRETKMAKKKATKSRRKATQKAISLKKTVAELDSATKALKKVRDRAEGEEKQELAMKVDSLERLRTELTGICHGFPLWVPTKGKG